MVSFSFCEQVTRQSKLNYYPFVINMIKMLSSSGQYDILQIYYVFLFFV
jgi:hypothetical protein